MGTGLELFSHGLETRKQAPGEARKKLGKNLGEKPGKKILELIEGKPDITMKEMADATGISEKGIEWHIERLKSEGVIKRVGAKKGGYWEILKG